MKNYWIPVTVGVVIVSIAAFLLMNKQQQPQTPTVPEESNTQVSPPPQSNTDAIKQSSSEASIVQSKEFVVTGSKFKFDPAEIKVKKGETVKITFKNSDGVHDLVIPDFKVATKQIKTGEQETIEFVADKSGQFEYYCSVGNHKAMGMVGKLLVE